ncbi:MAG: hypothetical protein ACJ8EA_11100, partial [Xanthobacteraceae bacterium]
ALPVSQARTPGQAAVGNEKEPTPDYVAMRVKTDHCGRREMTRPPTDAALAQFDMREGQRQQETPGDRDDGGSYDVQIEHGASPARV